MMFDPPLATSEWILVIVCLSAVLAGVFLAIDGVEMR